MGQINKTSQELSGSAALLEHYCLIVSKYVIRRTCFEKTILWCEGWFFILKNWPSSVTSSHENKRLEIVKNIFFGFFL